MNSVTSRRHKELRFSPEHEKDRERGAVVAKKLTALTFKETPAVAVAALLSVLSRVLVVLGEDPLRDEQLDEHAVGVLLRQHLMAVQLALPFGD